MPHGTYQGGFLYNTKPHEIIKYHNTHTEGGAHSFKNGTRSSMWTSRALHSSWTPDLVLLVGFSPSRP